MIFFMLYVMKYGYENENQAEFERSSKITLLSKIFGLYVEDIRATTGLYRSWGGVLLSYYRIGKRNRKVKSRAYTLATGQSNFTIVHFDQLLADS